MEAGATEIKYFVCDRLVHVNFDLYIPLNLATLNAADAKSVI